MTLTAVEPQLETRRAAPTVWGLTPQQVHDRFWASYGVQVVRQRERSALVDGAELFLLCEPQVLTTFRIAHVLDPLNWLQPEVLFLRVRDTRFREYREVAVSDEEGRFAGFNRLYSDVASGLTRVALTTDPEIALLWQSAIAPREAWRDLKQYVPRECRASVSLAGHLYDGSDDREVMECVEDLISLWNRPDTTIRRARREVRGVWVDPDAQVDPGAQFIGQVWVGAGRSVDASACIVGPAILWDSDEARPAAEQIEWQEIEPTPRSERGVQRVRAARTSRPEKRLFDILFSLAALAMTLPLYPLVMLAILLEDGPPFFFAHKRETLGGRSFGCLKFRSMRKDAEQVKQDLARSNQADGPQFFMENDPRLTRVGRFIRRTQIDELPQFWNVLVGDMSIVGPRPSPRTENQYCPAWREARLSVRPGVTGLWQVSRTREEGRDFQEWIRFDLEYVERNDWWLDLWIIWRTFFVLLPIGRDK